MPPFMRSGKRMSSSLLSIQEIVTRYRRGDNLFDITIEKWRGIKQSLNSLQELPELGPIIKSARTGGAFCLEYQENCLINCHTQHVDAIKHERAV